MLWSERPWALSADENIENGNEVADFRFEMGSYLVCPGRAEFWWKLS